VVECGSADGERGRAKVRGLGEQGKVEGQVIISTNWVNETPKRG